MGVGTVTRLLAALLTDRSRWPAGHMGRPRDGQAREPATVLEALSKPINSPLAASAGSKSPALTRRVS